MTPAGRTDPLHAMRAYTLAIDVLGEAWPDVVTLLARSVGRALADQLYRAVGSIGANLAEGYSRSSGRDRVRMFEYALGSAREATHWYRAAAPMLEAQRVQAQLDRLTQLRRLLLSIIPAERERTIRPDRA